MILVYIFRDLITCMFKRMARQKVRQDDIWESLLIGHIKPRSHCPGVRPDASRQFLAGGPGRTGRNRKEIRVRLYILGSATTRPGLGQKVITVCPGAFLYTTALSRATAVEPQCHYGESRK